MKLVNLKNHIKEIFLKNSETNFTLLLFSLFVSILIALPIINILFEIKPSIDNFDSTIISNAAVDNLDISKRVGYYYRMFIFLALFSGVLFYFFKRVISSKIKNFEILKASQQVSVLGIAGVIVSILSYTAEIGVYWVLILNVFLILGSLIQNNTTIRSVVPLLLSLPFSIIVYFYFKQHNYLDYFNQSKHIEKIAVPLDLYSFLFVLFTAFFSFLFYFIIKQVTIKNLESVAISIVAVIPAVSLIFEFYNILNKRFQIVIDRPFLTFFLTIAFGFLISIYIFYKKIKIKNAENILLGTFVLAVAIIICQPYRVMYPAFEFFENANHGIAIDHLIKYGKIPFVENFDAHMMQQQFFGYIYVLLNGYEPFSPSLYTSYFYVIEIIVFYFVLSKIFGKVPGLVMLISLPSIVLLLNDFALAGLSLFMVYKTLKNPTFKTYLYFWIVSLILCFYKLDVGVAAISSGISLILIFSKILNKSFFINYFIKTFLYVFGTVLILFIVLCLFKGINFFERLQEFLLAIMSNQNWAVTKMGDQSNYLFRLCYYLLPIATTFAIIILFFQKVIFEKTKNINFLLISIFFYYLFFIFNAQRGIVFHTFEFGNLARITSTIFLSILLLIFYYDKNKNLIYFSLAFTGFYLLFFSGSASFKDKHKSLIYQAVQSASFNEKFTYAPDIKSRLKYVFSLTEIDFLKSFLDKTLDKDETYYDFASTNMLYTLVDRISPSYVNQTPLMLNSAKAQDIELNKILKANIKVVLMPIKGNAWHGICGVYVDFKYYKLAEYFYSNFKPLYRNSLFDVYVRKDEFTHFNQKLGSLGSLDSNVLVTDFSVLNDPAITKNNVTITNNSGQFSLISNGQQPFIIGFLDLLRKNKIVKNDNIPSKLIFKTFSKNIGNFKIYWKTEANEEYSETNAKTFEIIPNSDQEIVLDFKKIPNELMISNNIAEVQLKEFRIVGNAKTSVTQPEKIDYFIGAVPYLWGEKTSINVLSKIQNLPTTAEVSSAEIKVNKINRNKNGVYVFIEADSNVEQTADCSIVVNDIVKANYNFTILPGKNKYNFRISSNFYWFNSTNPTINIKVQNSLQISKFAIISTDGKEIETYKSRGTTLSDITDEYWNGGVSKNQKLLLLDSSLSKLKMLQNATKIKFIDNSFANIIKFYEVGSFIHVEIKENAATISSMARYPNAIEIIK